MPLSSAWVDALLAKLTVRYGEAFMRQYADAAPEIVKADWAEVLDGFKGDDIAYALRYLPSEKPPNAMQFRDICRRAPTKDTPRLNAPLPVIPDALRERLAKAKAAITLGARPE